jgi:hypothetical protein
MKVPPLRPISQKATPTEVRQALEAIRSWFSSVKQIPSTAELVDAGVVGGVSASGMATPLPLSDVPYAPLGFVASGGMATIILRWESALYRGHATTEVYRAESDDIGVAVRVGTSSSFVYVDTPPNTSTAKAYYYWVRFVNADSVAGPFNAVSGTAASTGNDAAYLLEVLGDEIVSSELFNELSGRVDGLDTQWAIKLNNDGFMSGIGLASETSTATPYSQLLALADRFAVVNPNTAPISVSSITRSGSTATVTTLVPHGATANTFVVITGCEQKEYNGTQKVVSVPDTTHLTFTVAGSPATPAVVASWATAIKMGKASVPFVVADGVTYIDTALIANLSANNFVAGKIVADEVITGSVVGGSFASDLSITSVFESSNYVPGTSGWRLDGANGTGELNIGMTFNWSGVFGNNRPADNASSDVTLVNGQNCTIVGNTVTKTSGGDTWDSSGAYVKDSYAGGVSISVVAGTNNKFVMFGLNTSSPLSNRVNNFNNLEYAFFLLAGMTFEIYESGSGLGSYGTYNTGDTFLITYTWDTIRYYVNGTLVRSRLHSTGVTGDRLYGDMYFYSQGAILNNVRYSPMALATIGAPSGTTVGSTAATSIEAYALDPAARVNSYTTTINGGRIDTNSLYAKHVNVGTNGEVVGGKTSYNMTENGFFFGYAPGVGHASCVGTSTRGWRWDPINQFQVYGDVIATGNIVAGLSQAQGAHLNNGELVYSPYSLPKSVTVVAGSTRKLYIWCRAYFRQRNNSDIVPATSLVLSGPGISGGITLAYSAGGAVIGPVPPLGFEVMRVFDVPSDGTYTLTFSLATISGHPNQYWSVGGAFSGVDPSQPLMWADFDMMLLTINR